MAPSIGNLLIDHLPSRFLVLFWEHTSDRSISLVTSNAQVELGGLHPVRTMSKMETDTFYLIYDVLALTW